MVQRKVMNKVGIQDDHVKPENLLPSSSQHQEIKNKGADLKKKKMKKSGSFKKPDFERLHLARKPGKPPPLVLSATPIKTMMESTPNYMKSTTSSNSKKERAQVSSQSPQKLPDSERLSRRHSMNSKNNSDSSNKPTRKLDRTSSLKLVKTLTKTSSFKPARTSAKKLVMKATCSSTMKDHKFPSYLTLSPGATEVEGTSVMKVCSYSYCSLNGHHHHEPLPPLKCFLSARRRMVKAQRGLKLGCLSPCRAKPVRDIMKEFEAAQGNGDEKPPFEESGGFFVEIYSKEREETSQNNQDTTDSSVTVDLKPTGHVGDETKTENEQAAKSPSYEQIGLEIDSHENLHQSGDVTFEEMDGDDYFPKKNENIDIAEEDYQLNSVQAKTEPEFLNLMYESEGESTPSIQSEEADLETSDMDWESRMYSASYPRDGVANPILINHVIDLEKANSALDDALLDEISFKSDEAVGDNYEENLPDEIMQESMDDATESDDDKDRSDTLVDALATIDSAPIEKAVKKSSLSSEEDKEKSELEDVTSNVDPEVGNEIVNISKTQYEEFENSHVMSGNMNENLKNSIGTQTDSEFEDLRDTSGTLDEVLKRSIGTQTDIEDDESDALVPDCSSAIQSIGHSDELESSENKIDEATETTEAISLEDSVTGNANQNIYDTQVDSPKDDASNTRIKTELVGSNLNEESTICGIKKGTKRAIVENQESTEFNPRDPNFLPVQPVPEAEKVDLRHLTLDEEKNADGWMLDHALQQAVTKLAPARKRKVALLVEAFETVLPIPKYETRMRHTATTFSHARPMQACS